MEYLVKTRHYKLQKCTDLI